ncbi:MAG: phage tail tape measure protein [Turicibacter sp.]|nr:phage tail tape measure protein [Turicibacter sp.]
MADGTVVIDTDLDATGITNGVKSLGSIASKGLSVVTKAVKVTSTSIVGLASSATLVGMGFESSMSQVAATMGITVDEISNGSEAFELLKQAAKDAGSTTQFSASQSAEALNYLALAGYSAEQAVETLPTVLNLAAAGGMDLAYASDLVTDSMSALGEMAGDVENFVDKLAVTSQKSNTSVAQLGEAILTVGGTAKVLAGGTTELNTALGILADNGIKGSEGGTALRNVILSLTAPTDTAAKKMQELGLQVLDAEGNMRPMNDIFNDLNDILSDMSQGEQTQVLNELFNKTDLKSVNALLANSGERFDELSAFINECDGAAANMAETMNDNLKGRITQLGSALEGLGIEIYEALEIGLKGAVEEAIDSVGRLTDAFKNNGFEGLIEEAGSVLSDFLVKIAEYAPQVVNAAVQLIQSFINAIQQNLPTIIESAMQIVQSLVDGILQMLPQLIQMGIEIIVELTNGILQMLPQILQAGIDIIVELAKGITQCLPTLIPLAIDTLLTLIDTLVDNIDLVIDTGIELILALADGLIEALPDLIDKIPIIIEKLLTAIANNLPKLLEAGVTLIVKLAEGLIQAIPQLISKVPQLITSLLNALATYYKNIFECGSTILQKICDGILSMVGSLVSAGGDIMSSLIGAVTSAASGFFNIGKNIVEGLWNGITSMGTWIADKVSGFFSGIVDGAKKVLGIHSPSRV